MKKQLLLPLGLALITIVACGEKPQPVQEEETVEIPPKEERPTGPVSDSPATREYADTLDGNIYNITIQRAPNETLPMVENDLGVQFYDNTATISVKKDNEEVYNKTFRKQDFRDFIRTEDYEYFTLAGIGYLEEASSKGKLSFTTQVCEPGMDGGTLLRIELSTQTWKYTLKRDDTPDIDVTAIQPNEEE